MNLSNWTKLTLIITVTAAVSAFAQRTGDQMQPRRAGVSIYANETREAYEQPVAALGQNEVVTITEIGRQHFKVRTRAGVEGFVEKRELNRASQAAISQSIAFDAAEVIGYLDNPTPIYIIDMDDPNADPITLDRSFKDALKQNVDRETMERLAR